jgi:ABC-type multidrug transport system permease subunit
MLPGRFWQKELLEDLKSWRALATKVLLPLILLSPLAIGKVPAHVKAGGLAVAVLFTGTFGSAVGLVRLRESKMLERLAVLPLSPGVLVADYVLANALFDALQLLPPLVVVTWSGRPQPAGVLWVLICYVATLVAANAIGVLVALAAGSSGEVHLYAALVVLVVGGLSGLFTKSMCDPLGQLGLLLPFRHFSDALLHAWGSEATRFSVLAPLSGGALFCIALLLSSRLFGLRADR